MSCVFLSLMFNFSRSSWPYQHFLGAIWLALMGSWRGVPKRVASECECVAGKLTQHFVLFSIAKSPDCRRLDQLNDTGYLLHQSSFYVAPQEQETDVFMYGFSDLYDQSESRQYVWPVITETINKINAYTLWGATQSCGNLTSLSCQRRKRERK